MNVSEDGHRLWGISADGKADRDMWPPVDRWEGLTVCAAAELGKAGDRAIEAGLSLSEIAAHSM
jgi:hypothetical protein